MTPISRHPTAALAAALLFVCACSSDVTPASPPTLTVAAGDRQSALAATELAEPVRVLLRDGMKRPMSGARIAWRVRSGTHDVVIPSDSITDNDGAASARWLLDTTTGTHTLDVSGAGSSVARATAFANSRAYSNVERVPLVTYDGSGEAVHPDFVRLAAEWPGDPFRLVATPYPGGNQGYENPSFFTGSTGSAWAVPDGVHNPLVTPFTGYFSDPDAIYDPDANEIRIYYRRVKEENEIWLIRSSDGVRWSTPVLTVHASNHTIISPAVVRRSGSEWLMWSVNAGADGCGSASTVVELRHSIDGVSWTMPQPVQLADRDGFAWHIDVEWIPSRGEYWAVYPLKQPRSCVTDRLRFATSADGVHWRSYPSPLLFKGANEEMRDIIYRSSIDFDATTGTVSLWYSGATHGSDGIGYNWHLGWERMTMPALFARVNVPAWEAANADAAQKLPQLTNETAP